MQAEARIHVLQCSETDHSHLLKVDLSFPTIQLLTGGTQIGLSQSAV